MSDGKQESVIDSAVEKPLLKLHRTINVNSFWKAVHRLLSASIAYHLVGLLLQQNPSAPVIAKWTRFISHDFFAAKALKRCAVQPPRKKCVRLNDLFRTRSSFVRSAFYRRYMAPQRCAHGICFFFWKRRRLICAIAILRTATQGDFSPAEMKLLQHLYPQFLTALRRIESLEREHSVRMDFEEFLNRVATADDSLAMELEADLPKQSRARVLRNVGERTRRSETNKSDFADSCRDSGSMPRAQATMDGCTTSPIRSRATQDLKEEHVHHPRSPHLDATIHLKQLNSAGVAGPHFLIACENRCRNGHGLGDQRFSGCRLLLGSQGANRKLRNSPAKDAATRRSLRMPG